MKKNYHKKVNDLQVRANNNPHNRNISLELQGATARLKKIMLTKTKGAILRSKVRWHEEGERNTKYFYSLEKRHHDIKTVSKLKVGDNCYIEDQFEILKEEIKIYESLYCSTKINPNSVKNSPFSSSMLRIMTSLCVSFVRMCSKPLFEDYCYVNEDRLYNTE